MRLTFPLHELDKEEDQADDQEENTTEEAFYRLQAEAETET